MSDFDIKDFKLNTNYVIEASAGTGKTYNIVEIVSKLIENKINLNKILIVTYTDKATSELRNRIKDKLIDINSKESINNAEIYTIHSFCKTIIDEYPINGNFNVNTTLIDDTKIEEFACNYIRESKDCLKLIEDDIYSNEHLKSILINFTKKYYLDKNNLENTDVISLTLNDFTKNELDEYLFLKNAKTLDEVFNSNKFTSLKKYYDSALEDFNNTVKSKQAPFNNVIKRIENFNKGFSTKATKYDSKYVECWEFLNECNNSFKKMDDLYKKLDLTINYDLLKDFYIKWNSYKNESKLVDFSDMIRSVHEEVINNIDFLNKLKDKYIYVIIDEFQDTNSLQYDIFKSIFLNNDHYMIVVGDPKQSIYSFQGSDLTVYNKAKDDIINKYSGVLKTLNRNYRTNRYLVEGVNELIDSFKDCNNEFNSFVNFNHSNSINLKDNNKEFHTYINGNEIDKPIWIATNGKDSIGMEAVVDEDTYSDIVVSQIVDLCTKDTKGHTKLQVEEKVKDNQDNKRDVSFKDFCILCRTRSEIETIQYKLKINGIPYLLYKDSSLFKGRECANFIAILEAIVSPDFTGSNRSIYNKALFTDFFSKSLKEINSSYSLRDDTKEMSLIIKWKKKASKYDWAELIDSLLNDSSLREINSGTNHMQSLFNYIQIAQYILNSLTKGSTLNDCIKKLNDLSKSYSTDDEEDNANLVERSTDFDCVKLMTMHASKGLEFPIVISTSGLTDLRKNNTTIAYIHHEFNKAILTIGRYTTLEEIEENKRLFYVAYTRAKYLIITPMYKELSNFKFINNSLNKLIEVNSKYIKIINKDDSLCNNLKDKVKTILSYNTQSITTDVLDNSDNCKKLIDTKSNQLTHMHSYSSLTHSNKSKNNDSNTTDSSVNEDDEIIEEDQGFKDLEGIVDIDNDLASFDKYYKEIIPSYNSLKEPIKLSDNFPKGSRIGTILHEVFEKIDFTNYSNIDDLIKECFRHEGLSLQDEWINDIKNIVDNVLSAKLEEIHGSNDTFNYFSLNELTKDKRQCEIEFNFNFKDKDNDIKDYCNGFIDLIFERREYYSVLDWKSDILNELEEFTSYSKYDSLSKHTAKHYAIQRVLYSYTLVKYLNQFYKDPTLSDTFNNHFGGIYYCYLRGCNKGEFNGIYSQTWSNFEELETAYKQIVKVKVEKGE